MRSWPPAATFASHREKQGHHWYSASLGDDWYGEHYLKARRAAPLDGLLIMPPDPDPAPDKESSLHHLHTNDQPDRSVGMNPAEMVSLIRALHKKHNQPGQLRPHTVQATLKRERWQTPPARLERDQYDTPH